MDEGNDFDPMQDLAVPQRRRVLAMKDVQKKYDALHNEYQKELAILQHKYNEKYGTSRPPGPIQHRGWIPKCKVAQPTC